MNRLAETHNTLYYRELLYSGIHVPSPWRVLPFTLTSQSDMPSLTTVTLDKEYVFKNKKTVHTRSSSFSSLSFLDITPALQYYLQFIVSFTYLSNPNTKSPFSLHTTITHFLLHYLSFCCLPSHDIKHSFTIILSFHSNCRDQPKLSLH